MKKFLKIIGGVLCGVVAVALVFSIVTGYISYPFSFLNENVDDEFEISENTDIVNAILSGDAFMESDWFNYYGIKYSANCYFKGTLTYKCGLQQFSEDFFLEPSEDGEFFSFIDNFLDGRKADEICDINVMPLDKEDGKIEIIGVSTFNREISEREVFIQSQGLKLGVDLLWGGALSYLEDLNSDVEAVIVDGKTKVDSNASKRYNTEAVNTNVNLINRNDTGRLVQQSYYGTLEYDHGVYMENDWRYNPVQGGNQFNDASKIVDLQITDDSIYVKCRPLDWAKEKEFITPSYMEATYSIQNGLAHASCRFVDFSGYPPATSDREIPAFYCIEPFNEFVYYAGDKPWTDEALREEDSLIFWPDAGYPKFKSLENWSAFKGEFDDSFGVGLYVPGETEFLSGVYCREETEGDDPANSGPTSYIAVTKCMEFKSYEPFEYEFYLATGNVDEIRSSFKGINEK